ncbi:MULTISPECIES: hypothetical protein [Sphingomonadales]|jgi:hypothetical protein|uniref:HNH endonuclease n=2 Tax=Sphingomonadaceae TaxID=41297 RepID=A0ABV6D1K8_9SPHN|nr:hypothetical protein [Novosphingobium profundi]
MSHGLWQARFATRDILLSFSFGLTHRIVMPIMAEHRWLYPIDWPELSRLIRFDRAKGRCEHCRRPHGGHVFHLGDGRWWDAAARQWRDGRGRRVGVPRADLAAVVRITRVYLACAHLNHDPTDNAARNLAALCQRCHMIHDAAEHRRRRWLNAYRRRALGDLLDVLGAPYAAPTGCATWHTPIRISDLSPLRIIAKAPPVPCGRAARAGLKGP